MALLQAEQDSFQGTLSSTLGSLKEAQDLQQDAEETHKRVIERMLAGRQRETAHERQYLNRLAAADQEESSSVTGYVQRIIGETSQLVSTVCRHEAAAVEGVEAVRRIRSEAASILPTGSQGLGSSTRALTEAGAGLASGIESICALKRGFETQVQRDRVLEDGLSSELQVVQGECRELRSELDGLADTHARKESERETTLLRSHKH
ncbi:hypothetical protein KIPB_015940, partial [Kipferlia bialata]|eukprot:g15940.t1